MQDAIKTEIVIVVIFDSESLNFSLKFFFVFWLFQHKVWFDQLEFEGLAVAEAAEFDLALELIRLEAEVSASVYDLIALILFAILEHPEVA